MIDVTNLSFTYPGQSVPTLKQLTFTVETGEIFGFLGPSGAGKSTTQKLLIGLLRDHQGRIAVFGRDPEAWGADYYERIGVSFELPNHFLKLTALENLRYFGGLYCRQDRRPEELLAAVGLERDGDLAVGQYSKGMKNRLSLARALLHDPELLYLDEPTAGLDPLNARRIKDLIAAERAAGKTIFLTTHDMAVAGELCDRVAFIVDGEITLIDTPRRLRLQHGRRTVRVEVQNNGHLTTREFNLAGLADEPDFLTFLRNDLIQTMHTQEASLEEIFIQVTGRSLR